jgi:hypothetical protein
MGKRQLTRMPNFINTWPGATNQNASKFDKTNTAKTDLIIRT